MSPKYTTFSHSTGRAVVSSSEMKKGNIEPPELTFRGSLHGLHTLERGQLIE